MTTNLSVSSASGSEAGTTIITVTATAPSAVSSDQTVALGVSGTGITTSDYYLSNTTITIPNGQTSGSVKFIVADDAIAEGTETAILTISSPSAGLSLGATITQNIIITNNDNSFLTKVGGAGGTSGNGAEISAFDSGSKRLFVVAGNTIDFYTVSTTGTLTLVGSLTPTITPPAGSALIPNSVAVKNGFVAVAYAVQNSTTFAQLTGKVAFFNAGNGSFINAVDVGALPDMLTFTPDGTRVLVANEGEPNSYGQANSIDPEGSISIINIAGGVASATVQTADFTSFNSQMATLKAAGVRITGPGSTVAQDLEPEYIAVSPDGLTARITLQENNAIAILDIASATITQILPLGAKNYNLPGNGIDASDQDSAINGGINIQNWPVFGLYQPDAIASFSINGQAYYITANEGDSRNYPGFNEEIRVGAAGYVLDPTAFPNAAILKQNTNLGRLQLTNATGDTDGDGDIDRIESFGARSFSIWNANGTQVFDSGDQLEQITAAKTPTLFNSDGTAATFNTRSDNKGPEPEGVVIGVINGITYAFIGLERTGDVVVYDVSNPNQPTFIQYINTPEDIGTEGLTFISAADSPTGKPLLVTASEVSKTAAVFEVGLNLNTAPLLGTSTTLYNTVLNTLPSAQGWSYISLPNPPGIIPTAANGVTNLNTLANSVFYAGFGRADQILDNTEGYTLSFNAQVLSEARETTANKNNDGKDDRAGFSVILVSSDKTKSIELGFFSDLIWAQDGGTTSSDPNLFTQAESVAFNTSTNPVDYQITVLGNTYTIHAKDTVTNAITTLSGNLRDYTPFVGAIDPYETSNFIFFGDDTTSAKANINLGSISLTNGLNAPTTISIAENTTAAVIDLDATDVNGDTVTFTIGGADANKFNINTSTGVLSFISAPNFEAPTDANTDNIYVVNAIASDGKGGTTTRTLNIGVSNINEAPTAVTFSNTVSTLAENTSTTNRVKVADIAITDDALGTNNLSVSGTDASFFEISGTELYLKANTVLDYKTKSTYNITVAVDDTTVGSTPDTTKAYTLTLDAATPSVLSIAASTPTATETNTIPGVFTITSDAKANVPLSFNYTVGGTATNGVDYNNFTGTATIAAGQSSVDIKVTPVDDTLAEENETVTLTLASGTGYTTDTTKSAATITIIDNEPTVSVSAEPGNVNEGQPLKWNFALTNPAPVGGLVVKLDLVVDSDPLPGDISYFVNSSQNITNFELVRNADGTINHSLVTIAAGATTATLVNNVIADGLTEGAETIVYTLAARDNYKINPTAKNASFTIVDTSLSTLSIAASTPTATEFSSNPGVFTVTSDTKPNVPITFNYTIAGTATNGGDYNNLTGTATIAAGQSSVDIQVTPIDDTLAEGNETVTLTLTSGTGYITNVIKSAATVTIIDNEPTPLGTTGDDNLVATPGNVFNGQNNILFSGAGNDTVDLGFVATSPTAGKNIIDLGSGNDTIYVNKNDNVFGSDGNDTFFAQDSKGGNRISGGAGDDSFWLGANDRALGGDGNDIFRVGLGGGNLIAGGAGADQFWIVNAELPKAANSVLDFQIGTDVIGISGAFSLGISASTLKLNQVGNDTQISFNNQTLATLSGIQASSLSLTNPNQFVFA